MRKILIISSHPSSGWSMIKFSEMVRFAVGQDSRILNYIPPNRLSSKFTDRRLKGFAIYLERKIYSTVYLFCLNKIIKPRVILLCDHSDSYLVSLISKKKIIIFCHDLFAIKAMMGEIEGVSQSLRVRLELKFNLQILKKASRLIAVSESMRNEIFKIIPTATIHVISPTVLPSTYDKIERSILVDYCLLPMNDHWRKNRLQGITVFSKVHKIFRGKLHLVIVGNDLSFNELNFIKRESIESYVILTSNLPEVQMRNLYKYCKFVLFTSKYEGFGLPIIEANYHARLAIHTELPVLDEVAGGKNISVGINLEHVDWLKVCQKVQSAIARKSAKRHFENHYSFAIFKSKLDSILELEPKSF